MSHTWYGSAIRSGGGTEAAFQKDVIDLLSYVAQLLS